MRPNCYLDEKDLALLKEIAKRGEITAKNAEEIYQLCTPATWRRLSNLVQHDKICKRRRFDKKSSGGRYYYYLPGQ